MGEKLHCPFCHNDDSRVIDSRTAEEGNAIGDANAPNAISVLPLLKLQLYP